MALWACVQMGLGGLANALGGVAARRLCQYGVIDLYGSSRVAAALLRVITKLRHSGQDQVEIALGHAVEAFHGPPLSGLQFAEDL